MISLFSRVFCGLRALVYTKRTERELNDELTDYLESSVEFKISTGMSREDALHAARVELGSPGAVKDEVRDVGWETVLQAPWRDTRYALRTLRKAPVFTAAVVLTVALGIGANTILFRLVDGALFRTLDVERPEELVRFDALAEPGNSMIREYSGSRFQVPGTTLRSGSSLSYSVYEAFRDRSDTLSAVLAFTPMGRVTVTTDGTSDIAYAEIVTGSFFSTLGIGAELGRTIREFDDLADVAPVAMLSHSYWQTRFGSNPSIVGSTARINGAPVTIVGVAAPGFHSAMGFASDPVGIFLPLAAEDDVWSTSVVDRPWSNRLRVMARMKPGVTPEQVGGELGGMFQEIATEGWIASLRSASLPVPAETPQVPQLRVRPGGRGILGMAMAQIRLTLFVLSAVFGLVLIIVCLNVANLLVARGVARHHEIALRMSIGAKRGRIVIQLLTESAVLAAAGGALGIAMTFWGRGVFQWMIPSTINVVLDLRVDWRVVAFSLVATFITGLLFGLLPAIRTSRADIGSDPRCESRNSTHSRRRLTKTLVTAQVAMSVILVMAAGFFLRTLGNLSDMDLGFDPNNLLLFQTDLRMLPYEDERRRRLYDELVREIDALPGVVEVTTSSLPQVSLSQRNTGLFLSGATDVSDVRGANWVTVRGNYFKAIGIPIVRGRDFGTSDNEDAPRVAVVNEILAGQLFPSGDPIGQRFGFSPGESNRDVEIVGVVRDVQGIRATEERRGFLYVTERQYDWGFRTFQIRTSVEPISIATSVRETVRRIDPNIAVFDIKTQEQQIQESFVLQRMIAGSSGFFGGVALFLAAVGLYGVLSFSVAQQTHDLGIRMALGADQKHIVGGVVREAVAPIAIGIPTGLAGGVLFGRTAESLLYGLTSTDPVTMIVAVVLMAITATLGIYLPARRAASVDPLIALRYD